MYTHAFSQNVGSVYVRSVLHRKEPESNTARVCTLLTACTGSESIPRYEHNPFLNGTGYGGMPDSDAIAVRSTNTCS